MDAVSDGSKGSDSKLAMRRKPTEMASNSEAQEAYEAKESLKQEKLKSAALEEENKALRGQVATVLSYLDQVMPMDAEQ